MQWNAVPFKWVIDTFDLHSELRSTWGNFVKCKIAFSATCLCDICLAIAIAERTLCIALYWYRTWSRSRSRGLIMRWLSSPLKRWLCSWLLMQDTESCPQVCPTFHAAPKSHEIDHDGWGWMYLICRPCMGSSMLATSHEVACLICPTEPGPVVETSRFKVFKSIRLVWMPRHR